MKKVIAFAGSNSVNSINKQLAVYASSIINGAEVVILDLNDFELPLFGVDLETKIGKPENALKFLEEIKSSNGIIISLAEHNGSYSVAFKNLLDWMSRIDGKLWNNKPMLLMATSPGARGGASVLDAAIKRFPYMGGNIVSTFSLPSFNENLKNGKLVNDIIKQEFLNKIEMFQKEI